MSSRLLLSLTVGFRISGFESSDFDTTVICGVLVLVNRGLIGSLTIAAGNFE
jgi:hypothetical protein